MGLFGLSLNNLEQAENGHGSHSLTKRVEEREKLLYSRDAGGQGVGCAHTHAHHTQIMNNTNNNNLSHYVPLRVLTW